MPYYIYILTNKTHSTLYIGVTNNLKKRIYQHKNKLVKGFTNKYNIDRLIYFEQYNDIDTALLREKRMKKWKRKWKEKLVNIKNPKWTDLYPEILN